MTFVLAYYIIGVWVSLYHIWYYRLSVNKSKPLDGIGGLIGPWVWPAQIIVHQFTKREPRSLIKAVIKKWEEPRFYGKLPPR